MKKKILILGAAGMLGLEVIREFSKKKNVLIYATIRNLNDKKLINKYLQKDYQDIYWIKFKIEKEYITKLKKIVKNKDFIINCIGTIKPYINENNALSVENAIKINSIFPHKLYAAKDKKSKIYQIATDCVFNGHIGNYKENESHNADDVYGKSKSIGEVKGENFFNIRCSIIGKEIKNFKSLLCWFLSQKNKSKVFGFKDHLWNGVTTTYFAKVISTVIFKKIDIPNLIHITPEKPVNKYQLLKYFQKKFNRKDIIINKVNSNYTINRTLGTNYKKLNKMINLKIGYKKTPSINKMIEEML